MHIKVRIHLYVIDKTTALYMVLRVYATKRKASIIINGVTDTQQGNCLLFSLFDSAFYAVTFAKLCRAFHWWAGVFKHFIDLPFSFLEMFFTFCQSKTHLFSTRQVAAPYRHTTFIDIQNKTFPLYINTYIYTLNIHKSNIKTSLPLLYISLLFRYTWVLRKKKKRSRCAHPSSIVARGASWDM